MEPFDHDLKPPPLPDPDDDHGLLQNCPRCKYSVRGLPMLHACPECGLAIDRRWVILGDPPRHRPVWQYRVVLFPALAICGGCILVFLWLLATLDPKCWLLLVPVLLLGFLAVRGNLAPARGFVALGAEGLIFDRPARERIDVPWSEITKVGQDWVRGELFVQRVDGRRVLIPLRCAIAGLADDRAIRRCLDLLESYRTQYGAPAGAAAR